MTYGDYIGACLRHLSPVPPDSHHSANQDDQNSSADSHRTIIGIE